MVAWNAPGRAAAMYPVRQTGQARALFLFRAAEELRDDHGDLEAERRLLRERFPEPVWELPRILSELEAAPDYYFDSIGQIRMPTWSRGRVTLAGDAGYSPGPAVGGETALAVVGAFVLAGELAAAGGDHARAFVGYERAMAELVRRSRGIGPAAMKALIPRTPMQVWLTPQLLRLVSRLPGPLQRRLSALQTAPARALEASTCAATTAPPDGRRGAAPGRPGARPGRRGSRRSPGRRPPGAAPSSPGVAEEELDAVGPAGGPLAERVLAPQMDPDLRLHDVLTVTREADRPAGGCPFVAASREAPGTGPGGADGPALGRSPARALRRPEAA